jgi:hypothetical protein
MSKSGIDTRSGFRKRSNSSLYRSGSRSVILSAVGLGPVDEVAHDQEVAREAHLQDRGDLELQPLQVARALGFAPGRVGVQVAQTLLQPVVRGLAEVGFDGVPLGHGEVGQLRLAQREREAAAARDLHRVGQRRGQVGEQRLHLGRGLEVLFLREPAHAPGVAQDLALGDAHARLVRLVVHGRGELHRMRGHHGQLQARGQLHRGHDVGLVVGPAGALQLQVEAVRKAVGQLQRQFARARRVALQQRLSHGPGLGARQQDQAAGQLAQPGPAHHGLRSGGALRPGAREQFGQVQVALAVLRQQQHAREGGGGRGRPAGRVGDGRLQQHLGAQNRLDARATRGLVELDAAEQVVQVRDGQGWLAGAGRGGDQVIDAGCAVDDGKLGVQAQVNEHGRHFQGGRNCSAAGREQAGPGETHPRSGGDFLHGIFEFAAWGRVF